MKKLNIGGNLLKALLLAGLMTGCQNDDALIPSDSSVITASDENAKTNAELKLVKDGSNTLVYIKSGRFTGKLSKVYGQNTNTEYSYDDTTGDLWITSKVYSKANNALLQQTKYKIVNGKCVTSTNLNNGWTSQYSFSETGYLKEINLSSGALKQKKQFNYIYYPSKGVERLTNIISSTPVGDYEQIDFHYSFGGGPDDTKSSKYYLNPEQTGFDAYLPYFGKFSDVLVHNVEVTPLPYTNQAKPYYRYYYIIDNNGYATAREKIVFPLGATSNVGKQIINGELKYSTNWQGL